MIAKKSELLAKQSLNAMYRDSIGASKQERIIKVFGSLWLPLAIISIAISTFSIYMDLSVPLGFGLSLTIGLLLATVLVVFAHYSLDSLFTTFEGISKMMMGIIFLGLATISIITHFKSLNNFEKILVQDKRIEILKMDMTTNAETNRQVNKILETNSVLAKVFDNGTIHDDKEALLSTQSNNAIISLLKHTSNNKELQDEVIHNQKILASSLKDTLFLLFIVLEVLSYFSVVSKILLTLNTSDEVKNLTTHLTKLNEIEANVYDAVVTNKTEQVTNTVNQALGAVQNSPTPSYAMAQNYQGDQQSQPNKAQIAFNANSGSNAYNSDYYTQNSLKTNMSKYLPSFSALSDDFSECYTQHTDPKEREEITKNNINENEGKKEVLDLMKFSHKETEIIKVAFENGAVKEGDRLLQKSIVKQQFSNDRLITRKDVDNCYEKLEDLGLIHFKGGFRALAEMKNIVTNETEQGSSNNE